VDADGAVEGCYEPTEADITDLAHIATSDSTWTLHNDYPAACTNQFVRGVGDTLTCATVVDADVSDTITVSNYLSLANWYATTTDQLTEGATNLYNQTHTGDVAGATTLTIQSNAVEESMIDFNSAPTLNYVPYWNGSKLDYTATSTWDTDTNTTYTAGGTLLDLTGTTFSVNEGTLTDEKICEYEATGTQIECTITNNSTNWDTAYGWGDHAAAGYNLQAYASSSYVWASDWTTIDNYPAACGAGTAVTAIGDTNTCTTFLQNADIDTYSELNTIVADQTLTNNGLIDTSAELAAIVGDETGSGALCFATDPVFLTSMAVPQGASPTVNAAGELAVDTTTGQLLAYDNGLKVYSATSTKSFALESPVAADYVLLWKAPSDITIKNIGCLVDPQDTTGIDIDMELFEGDADGDATTTIDGIITCNNTNSSDDGSLSNATLDKGDWLGVYFQTASGTPSWVSATIDYIIDRK